MLWDGSTTRATTKCPTICSCLCGTGRHSARTKGALVCFDFLYDFRAFFFSVGACASRKLFWIMIRILGLLCMFNLYLFILHFLPAFFCNSQSKTGSCSLLQPQRILLWSWRMSRRSRPSCVDRQRQLPTAPLFMHRAATQQHSKRKPNHCALLSLELRNSFSVWAAGTQTRN